jgi:two-component system chemotaxis response regulator CheB
MTGTERRIRVLVVEDSLTVRERLCEVISAEPGLELVGSAGDGRRAIELCALHRPDVITMDMMLPTMTGLEATEHIMAHQPTPILIVSSSTNRGELFRTYDALAAGAVDVLEKPRGDEAEGEWEAKLVAAVKMVSRIRVITHPRARLGALGRTRPAVPTAPVPAPVSSAHHAAEVIAIGASTGGPGAVAELLAALPPGVRVPVLVVIHIGELFGTALADWLDTQSSRRVVLATDGAPLASFAGRVAMAPPGRHLVVRDKILRLTEGPQRHSCRPSVDELFESIEREYRGRSAACLLTGMGRDGAAGLLRIRNAGGLTIAQDERSCVVYGMPREAALLGAAQHILPLDEIAGALGRML